MDAWIFALFAFFLSNPYDSGAPFAVPVPMSLEAYREAALYPDVLPEEMVGELVSEHGLRAPFHGAESRGDGGRSLGAYQMQRHEWREYNEEWGTTHDADAMMGWRVNTAVAAFAIHDHKRVHATKTRCTRLVDGQKQRHTWDDHWVCSPQSRERCHDTAKMERRRRTIARFARWREYQHATAWVRLVTGWLTLHLEG